MSVDVLDKSVTEALRAWSTQHSAGISIADALKTCAPICAIQVGRDCFNDAADRAAAGQGIDKLMDALSPVLTESERVAISAGWSSGRVDVVMNSVISQRELWYKSRSKIRAKMAMPILVLLMGAVVSPLPAFFLSDGGALGYLFDVCKPLIVALGIWRLWGYFVQSRARATIIDSRGGLAPATGLDEIILSIPIASEIERQRNISEFTSLLSVLVGAGVNITMALQMCSRAAGNGVYRHEIAHCLEHVKQGKGLAGGFTSGKLWPVEFVASVNIGEKSGALEDVLARLSSNARERYVAAIEAFAEWLPRVAYGVVCCFVIYQIFKVLVTSIAPLYQIPG